MNIKRLWQKLTAPHPALRDPEQRRRARLLAPLALLGALLCLIALLADLIFRPADPSHLPVRVTAMATDAAAVALFGIIYALSRTPRYRLAAALTILTVYGAAFAALFLLPWNPLYFAFLLLGILVSALLLSVRATALVCAATLAGLALFVGLTPGLPGLDIVIAFLLVITTAALALAAHASHREDNRQIAQQAHALSDELDARKQTEQALRQRIAELSALYATTADLVQPRELQPLLSLIVERVATLLGATAGGLYLCEPDAQQVRCVVSYNTPRDFTGTTRRYGEGAAGRVAQTGEPLIVDDYRIWPGRAAVYDAEQPFVSVLSAPMIWEQQVIGVIHALHATQRAYFTQEHLSLLTSFAQHAALGVVNARLVQSLEDAKAQTESKYRALVEHIPAVIYIAMPDEAGGTLFVSPQIEAFTGYSQQEWLADPQLWSRRLHPEDRERVLQAYDRAVTHRDAFRCEYRLLARDGHAVWVGDEGHPLDNPASQVLEVQGLMFDITARKQTEEGIKAALTEKEALLREVHHRVKNNLQVISSILNLQASHETEARVTASFREMQARIRSMAMVHERFYRSGNLAALNIAGYVEGLVSYLVRAYARAPDAITLQLNLAPVAFRLDTAVPCGLIITELVSNALLHAFPDGRGGHIAISLQAIPAAEAAPDAGGAYTLIIADDGVGFPAEVDWRNPTTLGLELVHLLVKQLGGTIETIPTHGTEFCITFSERALRP